MTVLCFKKCFCLPGKGRRILLMGAGKALRNELRLGNWGWRSASTWRIKMSDLWGRSGAPVCISVGLWFNAEFRPQERWWGRPPRPHVMLFLHRLSASAACIVLQSIRRPERYCSAQAPDRFQDFFMPCERFKGRLCEGGVGSKIKRFMPSGERAFAPLNRPLGWRFRKSMKAIIAKIHWNKKNVLISEWTAEAPNDDS